MDSSTYDFECYIYRRPEGREEWKKDKTITGFFDVVPGQDNTWSVLNKKM